MRTCSGSLAIDQAMNWLAGHERRPGRRHRRTGSILGWYPTRGVGRIPGVPTKRRRRRRQFANYPEFLGRYPQQSQRFQCPYRVYAGEEVGVGRGRSKIAEKKDETFSSATLREEWVDVLQ